MNSSHARRALIASWYSASLLLIAGCCCCMNTSDFGGGDWSPTPSPHVTNVTDADFDSIVLQADKPTLVDFWAPWCGPCRMVDPAIVAIAEEYQGTMNVARLNVDENYGMADRYLGTGIPLLVIFNRGEILAQHEGVPMDGGNVEQAMRDWVAQQLEATD